MNPCSLQSNIARHFPACQLESNEKAVIKITKRGVFLRPASSTIFTHFNQRQTSSSKVVSCAMAQDTVLDKDKTLDAEEAEVLVSTCITRNLPAALTLEQGLDCIMEAVEELKANPPLCPSGMYRFQLAVPPSAKALKWFSCQPEASNVYPLFFVSNEMENPTYKSLSLGRTRGVFGIGSAVNFKGSSPDSSGDSTAFRSSLSAETTSSKAYGFLDMEFNSKMSMVKNETGSFDLFIPQIELDEFEDISFLSATFAWNASSLGTFNEAIRKFELSFDQARNYCIDGTDWVRSSLPDFNNVKEHNEMVRVNALLLDEKNIEANSMRDSSSGFSQFSARLSPSLAITNNMIDKTKQVSQFIQECPNINSVWASLMVEECTRLGLTYFCVAPGSRSSPLTIAASSHPLATCTVCIDERSLAFHALGYAKASNKPAVVITSSGTAVSNLFPAVVEASQNFVPLLVLSADRPPELVDVGANQAINQVNHFGVFARQFFSLQTPTDDVSARMVLTTVDSAVYKATSTPCGPVHINCPFREPLATSVKTWNRNCLKGLDFWMSNNEQFTSYIPFQSSLTSNQLNGPMIEVLKLIQEAKKGFLVLGSIYKEDDMWAALLLAKHLSWPVAVDVQSGLRLRKYVTSFLDKKNILFVDQLDQLLLSDSIRSYLQADVIVQIGSRITGRRIAQMIENSFPCSFIMVDEHSGRHDPSNIMTHRIQSTITQFSDCVIKRCQPNSNQKWSEVIRGLDMTAAWETSSFINSEHSLTEPYVARKIFDSIRCGSALFIGNSMPVRDSDMYGSSWVKCTHTGSLMSSTGLPCHYVQVNSNRGASGIDGLISTAVGFAVGSNKRVLFVIGDVSFLHDTNGLSLLRDRACRKPMVILVVNNHGGAIFSQLPVASTMDRKIMDQFFYTTHNVSIGDLCSAHGVKHVHVKTKAQLDDALFTSQREDNDCVVEVESSIDTNVEFHNNLRNFTRQASDHALTVLSDLSLSENQFHCSISKMEYSQYKVQLNSPPTSSSTRDETSISYREGFIINLTLQDGSTGYGEVAPLEIHEENLQDVEEQLRFLVHIIEGKSIDNLLPLLKYSFSYWIWNNLGIPPNSIYPSVRSGLETALLSAISSKKGCSLLDILHPGNKASNKSPEVEVCALIDSYGTPSETASIAAGLVAEGFKAIKIKVARRRGDPEEDIAVIQEVRKKVGQDIVLRVDANRKWTYDEAVKFAVGVKECGLQYIEEPVNNEVEIVRFCEETGLPVALDETINSIRENSFDFLQQYIHSGIAAVVIKPSVIGGFENAAAIARWAQQHGKMAVVSAAYESSIGLSAFVQFAHYLDLQNSEMKSLMKKDSEVSIAHGFGTYKWFKEQVTSESLRISHNPDHGSVVASAVDAGLFLQHFKLNSKAVVKSFVPEQVTEYQVPIDVDGIAVSVKVRETGQSKGGKPVVFLHGFLGTGEDWTPLMKAFSNSTRCIAIDLPGHGGSMMQYHGSNNGVNRPHLSIDVISSIVNKVLQNLTLEKVTLVGYSMGARIALYSALKCSEKVERAVIISGSPGLIDTQARTTRKAKDDFRASNLISNGLKRFLDSWYTEELWASLRVHPHFNQMVENRLQHSDILTLGKVLSDMSIGRQPSLWEDLKGNKVPIHIIVGEKDAKFKKIANQMLSKLNYGLTIDEPAQVVEIENAGHAAHIENPLAVMSAVRQFISRENKV